tara:strand:- start:256 stop:606 length:351 start_codon:yes stop_codon:yes gene_type:complete
LAHTKNPEDFSVCFGFKEIQRFTKDGWDGEAAILRLGETELELFHFKEQIKIKDDQMKLNAIGLKHIGIEVASVDETHQQLKELNVDIDLPKDGTTCKKYCFLRDPNSVVIELYEK